MRTRRLFRVAGMSVALLMTASCGPQTPPAQPSAPTSLPRSHPDPSCVGECLTGKDPFESGCAADAYTVKPAHVVTDEGRVIGVVELRVSPTCGTGWARVLRTDELLDGEILGGVSVDAGASWLTYRARRAVSLWTDMHDLPAHACVAASAILYDRAGRPLADETWATNCRERRASLASHFRIPQASMTQTHN